MSVSNPSLLNTDVLSTSDMNFAVGLEVVTIGDRVFAYVAGDIASTIVTLEVFADGTIAQIATITDTNLDLLSGVNAFASAEVNGTQYLYVGADNDSALNVFEIGAGGALTFRQVIDDDAITEMSGLAGQLTVATTGSAQFLLVHGGNDNGVSVFQIGADGTLTNTFNLDDASDPLLGLDDASDTASIRIGGTTFVFVVGSDEDAVSVFRLLANGTLELVETQRDTVTTELNGPEAVEVVTIGARTFLYVGTDFDDSIVVYEVDNTGALTFVENILDSAINSVNDLEIFAYNGTNYLAVTAGTSDSLAYYEIATDGTLTVMDSVSSTDDMSLLLDNAAQVQYAQVDGLSFLLVTSSNDDGVSVFQLDAESTLVQGTPDDDILVGGMQGDDIEALGGDDVVVGGLGDDTLDGGEGADVLVGGDGNDRLFGDGDLSQKVSDVVTITETGQDLALSVTLPDAADASTINVSGLINRDPIEEAQFNIVYVIDISSSMDGVFQGIETVGDANNDGVANTLLDGTIEAFNALNNSIIGAGFGASDASIVRFNSSASTIFTGSIAGGIGTVLSGLDATGGTDFEEALQEAIEAFQDMGSGQNVLYFLSDGANNGGTATFADEVQTLLDPNGLDATINAVGLGTGSNLSQLDLLDDGFANDSAEQVLEPSALTANLTGSPVDTSEVERLEIYVNGALVQTLDDTEFTLTPLGLQYDVTVSGLDTEEGDTIEVVLVASDTAQTEVSVTLTVPNGALEEGDDVIVGGAGNDFIDGNGANDSLFGDGGSDVLIGGAGGDLIEGGNGNDFLIGGTGDDTLFAGRGRDTLQGGEGDDVYFVDRSDFVDESMGGGFDTLGVFYSIDLRDVVYSGDFEGVDLRGRGNLDATGTDADNLLDGNRGDNTLTGLDGADTIQGGDGDDLIDGGDDRDVLSGGAGSDEIFGGASNDTIDGGGGADLLEGGGGQDVLIGLGGNDEMTGDGGNDTLDGGMGNDDLRGNDGDDTLFGGEGDDDLAGSIGRDVLDGGNGQDDLRGGKSNDILIGGGNSDELYGGSGRDTIDGGGARDTIFGGTGDDELTGGAGNDAFVFSGNFDRDVITDFNGNNAEDIDLSAVNTITSFADLTANHMTQVGDDVRINAGGGNTITLLDVDMTTLGSGDFLF